MSTKILSCKFKHSLILDLFGEIVAVGIVAVIVVVAVDHVVLHKASHARVGALGAHLLFLVVQQAAHVALPLSRRLVVTIALIAGCQ